MAITYYQATQVGAGRRILIKDDNEKKMANHQHMLAMTRGRVNLACGKRMHWCLVSVTLPHLLPFCAWTLGAFCSMRHLVRVCDACVDDCLPFKGLSRATVCRRPFHVVRLLTFVARIPCGAQAIPNGLDAPDRLLHVILISYVLKFFSENP